MKRLELVWKLYKLRRHTTMSKGKMQKLQEKRLREMLSYAYQHSVYYRNAFETVGIGQDSLMSAPLASFPTLDKETLLMHFEELITVPSVTQESMEAFDEQHRLSEKIYRGHYHIVHSSGSTGTAKYFLYDEAAWEEMCLGIIRGALWGLSVWQIFRLLRKNPRILYVAAVDGRYGGAMAVTDGITLLGAQCRYLSVNTPVASWCREVELYRPNVVIGYPSALKILAGLKQEGQARFSPSLIITCGEPLERNLREFLESVFDTEVVNFYGASESLALGVEVNADEGMYLFDDMNYIETIDGQMYLTSLYNKAQPLIRYHLTDILKVKSDKAPVKCPFTRIETIQGRNEDVLWFRDMAGSSDFLHPLSVEGICLDGVLDYQFVQLSPNELEMLVELEKGSDEDNIRRALTIKMRNILEEKRLDYVWLFISFVDRILPNPMTGKKPLMLKEY